VVTYSENGVVAIKKSRTAETSPGEDCGVCFGVHKPVQTKRCKINGRHENMNTAAATTMLKMLESVPEPLQEEIVEHMRDYIEDIRDEAKWKESFSRTQDKLAAAARQARQEITEGKAGPMDVDRL
jgi:hypothetical protein